MSGRQRLNAGPRTGQITPASIAPLSAEELRLLSITAGFDVTDQRDAIFDTVGGLVTNVIAEESLPQARRVKRQIEAFQTRLLAMEREIAQFCEAPATHEPADQAGKLVRLGAAYDSALSGLQALRAHCQGRAEELEEQTAGRRGDSLFPVDGLRFLHIVFENADRRPTLMSRRGDKPTAFMGFATAVLAIAAARLMDSYQAAGLISPPKRLERAAGAAMRQPMTFKKALEKARSG